MPQDSPVGAMPVHASHESLGITKMAIGAEHFSAAGGAGEACTQRALSEQLFLIQNSTRA